MREGERGCRTGWLGGEKALRNGKKGAQGRTKKDKKRTLGESLARTDVRAEGLSLMRPSEIATESRAYQTGTTPPA